MLAIVKNVLAKQQKQKTPPIQLNFQLLPVMKPECEMTFKFLDIMFENVLSLFESQGKSVTSRGFFFHVNTL